MLLLADVQTYWLNVTNVALGSAVFFLIAVLLRAIAQDVRQK